MTGRILRQTMRGTGTLPHVGNHPGTYYLLLMAGAGAVAGARNGGIAGVFYGAAFMLAVLGPMYLWGAYDRARLSDAQERRSKRETIAE